MNSQQSENGEEFEDDFMKISLSLNSTKIALAAKSTQPYQLKT